MRAEKAVGMESSSSSSSHHITIMITTIVVVIIIIIFLFIWNNLSIYFIYIQFVGITSKFCNITTFVIADLGNV
jgi:uncharacterized membrane protein